MKIKDGFFLKRIKDTVYLLPYGNRIAAHEHGVQLIGCGELLASHLLQGREVSREELLDVMVEAYGDVASRQELMLDLNGFIQMLQQQGLLDGTSINVNRQIPGQQHVFTIAGIQLEVTAPKELIHPLLKAFKSASTEVDLKASLAFYERPSYPVGQILVRSKDVVIYEQGDGYIMLYPENQYVRELQVKKDGTAAILYLLKVEDAAAEEVFLTLRSAFLIYAQQHQMFALHSVSVEYEHGVVLFSGVSGAGKSTHGKLWEQQFGTKILNGDLNLIGREADRVMVYGVPWCGTSGISEPFRKPLLGVFFIHQGKENHCAPLIGAKRSLALSNRMISPSWTREAYEANLEFADRTEAHLLLSDLYCNVTPQAAEVARAALQTYIDEKEDNQEQ